eukprot:273470-Rhodomonas_salina.3
MISEASVDELRGWRFCSSGGELSGACKPGMLISVHGKTLGLELCSTDGLHLQPPLIVLERRREGGGGKSCWEEEEGSENKRPEEEEEGRRQGRRKEKG